MPELTDIERAREMVLARAPRMPTEEVALPAALDRVLAEDVSAGDEAIPGFDNSAMDGYAVRAADVASASEASPAALAVVDESRAGHPAGVQLGERQAIAISTGAMVPAGADAVVRVEDTQFVDGRVEVLAPPTPGANIRRAGEDVEPREELVAAGTTLGPAELGVLASVGRGSVRCAKRPGVTVITTGDELVGPEEPLFPGAVRNSNAYSVPPLATAAGGEVERVARVRDQPAATRKAIADALRSDVLVVCGGVSVGEHDHVRAALEELGVEQVFWGVSLRPGKPTYFGVATRPTTGTVPSVPDVDRPVLVFGLPGNPVSAMVTFLLFARPAIRAMLGAADATRRATAILAEPYAKNPGRAHAVRVRLELRDDGWYATPTKEQGSHVLTSMLGADALAYLPADRGDFDAGERVDVELLPARSPVSHADEI